MSRTIIGLGYAWVHSEPLCMALGHPQPLRTTPKTPPKTTHLNSTTCVALGGSFWQHDRSQSAGYANSGFVSSDFAQDAAHGCGCIFCALIEKRSKSKDFLINQLLPLWFL